MKKAEVEIGGKYTAMVSGKPAVVKILGPSPFGGWVAVNVKTQREVRIRSAQRLRKPAGGRYVIAAIYDTCTRYLTEEPRWVASKLEGKAFESIEAAKTFFFSVSGCDTVPENRVHLVELAK